MLTCGWGQKHPRRGRWSLMAVMSDWQRGVDWLLVKYYRCRLQLHLRWCRWRASTKGLCLAGPPRSGETSRLGLRDSVVSGVECGPHGGKKSWEPCVVQGLVDGRFPVWWVIDNVVWTDSWLSIAGAGCGLTRVGAGEEQARKVVAGEASRCGEDK
jgi:hypothetical protein